MREPPFFSIIIPTYNRAFLLEKSIISLQKQNYPSSLYEIVIVDNASFDNTKKIAEKFLSSENPSIRYMYEQNPGSNFARNTGAFHAKGNILVFIDDDAFADPSWLYWLSQAFLENDDILVVNGKIELEWEKPKPAWIPQKYESYLGCNSHLGSNKRDIKISEPVFEGNLAIRRNEFFLAKGFDIQYGMVASKIGANDGTRLIDQLHRLGKVIYQPEAIVYHFVPVSKTQPSYFLKRGFYQGIGDAKITQTRQQRNKFGLTRAIVSDLVFLFKEFYTFLVSLIKESQDQNLENFVVVFNRLGVIKQRFIMIFSK